MLRATVLSILMLSMVVITLPSVEIFDGSGTTVEASRRRSSSWRARQNARRARWRRIQQRRRALARQRRQRRNNSARIAARTRWRSQQRAARSSGARNAQANTQHAQQPPTPLIRQPMMNVTLPERWSGARAAVAGGETRWSVRASDGSETGMAALRPFGTANPANTSVPVSYYVRRSQSIGGVSLSTLRRAVIERMVAEGGWVTNDFVREIGGRRTFVVTGQTGQPNAPSRVWSFYFTEVDGGVYSLTTAGLTEHSETLAGDSARMLGSLRGANSTAALSAGRPE